MGHESFDRDQVVGRSSDRSFGLVFTAVFLAIAILPWIFGRGLRAWSLGVAAAFGIFALLAPGVLAPLNKLWHQFGLLLHRIVSPIVLGVMFFVVITPIGLLLRALGKDPLRLRLN